MQRFQVQEKTTTSSYIGLMRNEENIQEWMWADGSEVNYTNWNEGEPNSENEKVAEIYDSTRSPGAENGMTVLCQVEIQVS